MPSPGGSGYWITNRVRLLPSPLLTRTNMPKLKTRKTISKRVRVTKTGKIKSRKAGQDHFNARQTGKKKRNKRKDITASSTISRNIKRAIN